jgi:hypothetical protein
MAGGHAWDRPPRQSERTLDAGIGHGEKRIGATFNPTCFMVANARACPLPFPAPLPAPLFSFGDQLRNPPNSEKFSRISVEGVSGYPAPKATPALKAANAIASFPLSNIRSDSFMSFLDFK